MHSTARSLGLGVKPGLYIYYMLAKCEARPLSFWCEASLCIDLYNIIVRSDPMYAKFINICCYSYMFLYCVLSSC